jgi:2-oxo-3-hexenedioate decarboxylase
MAPDIDALAHRLLAAEAARRSLPPLTEEVPDLDLAAAYRVGARIRARREAAGARVIGRKIGFTNATIWDEYNVHAPIWAPVYDRTFWPGAAHFDLSSLIEPRIEPEIVLRLCSAPEPEMDDAALMACVGAVSHGFEIVQSPYPGWRFAAPDAVAAFGLHGALIPGPFTEIAPRDRAAWLAALADFSITLSRNGAEIDSAPCSNVLGGGPLAALAHLVRVLAADPEAPPLSAGEMVTTGTLTRAFPVAPGETWSTRLEGLDLPGCTLRFGAAD